MKLISANLIAASVAVILINCGGLDISEIAMRDFESRAGAFEVTVLPVRVVAGGEAEYNNDLGLDLVSFLEETGIAAGQLSETAIEFPVQWHRNQAKMLRESAAAVSEAVPGLQLDTKYALQVELLCNPQKTYVGGIHLYLLNQAGEYVDVRLSNSHWAEFKEIVPKSPQDGLEVAKLMIKNNWQL